MNAYEVFHPKKIGVGTKFRHHNQNWILVSIGGEIWLVSLDHGIQAGSITPKDHSSLTEEEFKSLIASHDANKDDALKQCVLFTDVQFKET
jgi:hypothetical protein